MGYPITRAAILDMIGGAVRETDLARGIARKGLIPVPFGGESTGAPTDPWGTYAKVDELGSGTHSQYGSVLEYESEESFEFEGMARYADHLGVDEVMILANVTEVGNAGSSLYLTIDYDADSGAGIDVEPVPFTSASPTVPLDEVGLHLSSWERIDWPVDSLVDEERPAIIRWWIDNPSEGGGSVGLGLCQLFVRGDLD